MQPIHNDAIKEIKDKIGADTSLVIIKSCDWEGRKITIKVVDMKNDEKMHKFFNKQREPHQFAIMKGGKLQLNKQDPGATTLLVTHHVSKKDKGVTNTPKQMVMEVEDLDQSVMKIVVNIMGRMRKDNESKVDKPKTDHTPSTLAQTRRSSQRSPQSKRKTTDSTELRPKETKRSKHTSTTRHTEERKKERHERVVEHREQMAKNQIERIERNHEIADEDSKKL